MTLPQAQRGFCPSSSLLVSTKTTQWHAACVQCQRSPDFIIMALHLPLLGGNSL